MVNLVLPSDIKTLSYICKNKMFICYREREREMTWYKENYLYPTNGSNYKYNMTCSLPKL